MTMKPPSTNSTRERVRARDDNDGSMAAEAGDLERSNETKLSCGERERAPQLDEEGKS
jgi:hypothetical protein